jgi:hypothetical protein
MAAFFRGKSSGQIHVADRAALAIERRRTKNPEGTVGSTTVVREPRQNQLLILVSRLGALLFANLASAQPLTAPTLVH